MSEESSWRRLRLLAAKYLPLLVGAPAPSLVAGCGASGPRATKPGLASLPIAESRAAPARRQPSADGADPIPSAPTVSPDLSPAAAWAADERAREERFAAASYAAPDRRRAGRTSLHRLQLSSTALTRTTFVRLRGCIPQLSWPRAIPDRDFADLPDTQDRQMRSIIDPGDRGRNLSPPDKKWASLCPPT